jgi:hypothetical protein
MLEVVPLVNFIPSEFKAMVAYIMNSQIRKRYYCNGIQFKKVKKFSVFYYCGVSQVWCFKTWMLMKTQTSRRVNICKI